MQIVCSMKMVRIFTGTTWFENQQPYLGDPISLTIRQVSCRSIFGVPCIPANMERGIQVLSTSRKKLTSSKSMMRVICEYISTRCPSLLSRRNNVSRTCSFPASEIRVSLSNKIIVKLV